MSGIAGLRGTGDFGTDERPKSFREKILFINPNGDAPIFALTSKAGKMSVTDPEFAWWAETNNNVRLTVSGALGTTDTTVTVTGSDPAATTMTSVYKTATQLKPGDLLMCEITDATTYDPEIIEVDSIISDTQFTCARGAAGSTAASMADASLLTLIGSAFSEGTAAPRAVARNPVKFSNYIQIFKDTYELTGTVNHTTFRTGDPWSNDKKRKMFDHSRGIEWSFMYGRKSETTGSNGKPKRTLGGLRSQIPQATPANGGRTTVFSSAVTAASFADAVSPVWDFDLGGGDTRIGFCGNTAITELGKVIQATTGIKMELGPVIKIFGVNFREFVMPQGRLLIKTHPLLSRHPRFTKSMFILDFAAIKYVTQKGRPDAKVTDDIQLKDEDVRRGFIQTDCSLMVDGGGLSCAYLGNISAT